MDVFDLIKTPERIRPELAFEGLFLAIGLGLSVLALLILLKTKRGTSDIVVRFRRMAWFLVPFSLIWTTFTLWMSIEDIRHIDAVRADVKQGRYFTLEGCLDHFRAGLLNPGKTITGNERWGVNGHEFSYGDNEIRFAYHKVEPRGGLVHADSWVKVSFVPDQFLGRDDIIRLESKRRACPPAIDIAKP